MQAPNIDISKPVEDGSYAGILPCKIKVTDNYEVAKVSITIGSRTWDDFETGAKKVIIDIVLDISDLDTGEWLLTVEAEDGAGNSSDDDRELRILIESILHPHKIAGSDSGEACNAYTYSTGGASSNVDHDLQYRFDWGDGTYSDWSSDTSALHAWENLGTYYLKAQARCAIHTNLLSDWSPPHSVAVQPESISTPYAPSGSSNLCSHTVSIYSTRGASSSCGHSLEYRFDWGGGYYSDWSLYRSAGYPGGSAGTREIKVQARCTTHTNAISDWSAAYVISIQAESISTPDTPSGSSILCASTSATYTTGGASSSCGHILRYRFDWGNGNYSDWSLRASADHAWVLAGTYEIKAQARCLTDVLSDWSSPMIVTIDPESIATPSTPSGPDTLYASALGNYSTSGAASSCEHSIDYRFDWGDGTCSGWSSSTDTYHSWGAAGSYQISAQARCATHTNAISDWSSTCTVAIHTEVISKP